MPKTKTLSHPADGLYDVSLAELAANHATTDNAYHGLIRYLQAEKIEFDKGTRHPVTLEGVVGVQKKVYCLAGVVRAMRTAKRITGSEMSTFALQYTASTNPNDDARAFMDLLEVRARREGRLK